MTPHAQALLLAFRDPEPVFEASALRRVPVVDRPLTLSERGVSAAMEELERAGLIRQWTPPAEGEVPGMCLRRYWPAGRIWIAA